MALTGSFKWVLWPPLWFGLLLVAVVFVNAQESRKVSAPGQAPTKTQARPVVEEVPESLSTRLLFVGDVFWGRGIHKLSQGNKLRYAYPMSGLEASDRANYDAWIANFECPITTTDISYEIQESSLRFNCRPEYLAELSKWFTAASLANNHTSNNGGTWGMQQTRSNLNSAGIQYFGNYNMRQADDICEVVSVPARTPLNEPTLMPIALCGYMYVMNVTPSDAQLAIMANYAKVMPVFAIPHMGVEYIAVAEQPKINAYRRMIDAGADAVLGAHPHVIQNSESYKGKLIAYSMGNFLFDQQSLGSHTSVGLGVGIHITVNDDTAVKIYQAVAKDCLAYKDTCLEALQTQLQARPEILVSYNFTCYDQSDYTPSLGSQEVCDDARQRASIEQLGGLSTKW